MERPGRTVVKAIIWNINGLLVMGLVGYAMTGSAGTGGFMAVVNTVIGLGFYLLYERIWARISWGRINA